MTGTFHQYIGKVCWPRTWKARIRVSYFTIRESSRSNSGITWWRYTKPAWRQTNSWKINILYKNGWATWKVSRPWDFEPNRGASDINNQQFLINFDQRYHNLKRHQTTISEDLIGFKLPKAANLSSHHEQLIKATVTHIDYETIKAKIKSIFSNEI